MIPHPGSFSRNRLVEYYFTMLQQAPFWLQLAADRIHVFSVELAVPPHSVGRTLILQNPASLLPLRNLRNLCHHDVFLLTRLYVASLVLSFRGVLITVALGMRRTSWPGPRHERAHHERALHDATLLLPSKPLSTFPQSTQIHSRCRSDRCRVVH